ncbi:MAG: NrfD/PsrC family molybdoenzyme membrane anchor subunit [Verrucomicrobiae bacterium]|nr:NrfD/PsrC family molybdoenzyme membrane anchor subunit [Verrucomicrobiae bacterium]
MSNSTLENPNVMVRRPLVANKRSYHWVSDKICSICEDPAPLWWWFFTVVSFVLMMTCFALIGYQISTGVGVWGLNHPVGWAWDITNFVFWIGIGHAGTLISAILFLTRQKWRTSINRAAEAMTLFAVICAAIFPGIHVGRVWMAWYLAPIPNSNAIWQNFRSPLLWDVFAVSTYFTVSVLFWYTGLIPDLALLRDRAKNKIRKVVFGILALGWRGSNRQWSHYEKAYLILAGISTPLVLSVHSVVSFDFATSILPGWHTTIFPPYFVAGAIFGGFAMVLTIMLPARWVFGLHDMITQKHIDNMCKILVLTGTIVGYAYIMELFIAWYGGNPFEKFVFIKSRVSAPFWAVFGYLPFDWAQGIAKSLGTNYGPYWWAYWAMMSCNVISPQFLWFKKIRENPWLVWMVCMAINAGMWFERFVIIVTSLFRDFLPSSWGYFKPTWVDIWTFVGTFGLFLFLFLLFMKFLPMIAISEVKGVMPESDPHNHDHDPKKEGSHH